MLREMLEKVSHKLKKPLIVLGATGFSTTVVACYGPPTYQYNTELENGAIEVLTQCVDGSRANAQCAYGCQDGLCIAPDMACTEGEFVEMCGQNALTKDKKIVCKEGAVAEVPCANCHAEDGQLKCDDNGQ
ncbi:MAG: hypothetical protein IJ165_07020 [Proteobacteria bacterium]|nr:hypothetical protein [Pseudomonadota bacterium]